MLLHAERPLGISLRILPSNSSIQACIKSFGNHAKKSYLALEIRVKRQFLLNLHDSLYSIYTPYFDPINSNIQYCRV